MKTFLNSAHAVKAAGPSPNFSYAPLARKRTTGGSSPNLLQRQCACGGGPTGECEECRQKREAVQRRATGPESSEPQQIVHDVLRSPGQPLDERTRAFMEPRFGHDFSQVRVHTDSHAADSARAVNALAYTVGSDVVFAAGQHDPDSPNGRQLLAHELTHVLQQADNHPAVADALKPGDPGSAAEREAESISHRINQVLQVPKPVPLMNRPASLARALQPTEEDGSLLERNDTDKCANFEQDQDTMAWSIVRETLRKLGRPITGPLLKSLACESIDKSFKCTAELDNGDTAEVRWDTDKNDANCVLRRGDDAIAICILEYSCPETWQILFTTSCAGEEKSNRGGVGVRDD